MERPISDRYGGTGFKEGGKSRRKVGATPMIGNEGKQCTDSGLSSLF